MTFSGEVSDLDHVMVESSESRRESAWDSPTNPTRLPMCSCVVDHVDLKSVGSRMILIQGSNVPSPVDLLSCILPLVG